MNILAVDDEPLMLWQLTENLKRIFEKPEYRVSGFDEVDDVMEWLDAQEKGSIAYAFLDIKLRGMSGIELAKDIRERSPKTKVIFLHRLFRLCYGSIFRPCSRLPVKASQRRRHPGCAAAAGSDSDQAVKKVWSCGKSADFWRI